MFEYIPTTPRCVTQTIWIDKKKRKLFIYNPLYLRIGIIDNLVKYIYFNLTTYRERLDDNKCNWDSHILKTPKDTSYAETQSGALIGHYSLEW